VDRHARQLVLPDVGVLGQRRLAAGRVAIVGCGGLGAPVIQQLAAAGVGRLTLIDDDVVETSNLNRQTLFRSDQRGMRKAVAAAAFVRALDDAIAVDPRVFRLTSAEARNVAAEHDVVVDCTDGLPTKYLLNDACVAEDRPLVHGAATAWSGQVLVVPGRSGPCLRCLFPTLPGRGTLPTCRTAGILAPVTGVVGSLQAAEVLKLLLKLTVPGGRFLAIDLKQGNRTLSFSRDPACASCGERPCFLAKNDVDYQLPDCDDEPTAEESP